MKKSNAFVLLVIALLVLVGCAPSGSELPRSETGLKIEHTLASLGDRVYMYEITLVNQEQDDVHINWIEPVPSEVFSKKLLTRDNKVMVEEDIAPESCIEISGQVEFDAQGASKAEILSWEPFIIGYRVACEKVLPLPGYVAD